LTASLEQTQTNFKIQETVIFQIQSIILIKQVIVYKLFGEVNDNGEKPDCLNKRRMLQNVRVSNQ